MKISMRLGNCPTSPIDKYGLMARRAKKDGAIVHHLNIGNPDISTPEVMIDALKQWKQNPISYVSPQGDETFIKSINHYYQQLGFMDIKNNIQVTTGGSEAINMALFATCDPNDEIITFEPMYANYNFYAFTNGIRLVAVRTKIDNGFHLPEREKIEEKINPKTKAILICTPNNPTGTVYTKTEMDMLVALAKKYNLFIISDETYREFCFDGNQHISLLTYLREIPEQIIVIDSLSKRYSLCGARLGCLISLNQKIMSGTLRLAQGRICSGSIDQTVGSKLTQVTSEYFQTVNNEYEKRRNLFYTSLKQISGITIPKPEGAFYLIAGLPVKDADDFCSYLLTTFRDKNETVMLTPATGFYITPGLGRNEVRIAYVVNCEKITRSVDIIKKALNKYQLVNQKRN